MSPFLFVSFLVAVLFAATGSANKFAFRSHRGEGVSSLLPAGMRGGNLPFAPASAIVVNSTAQSAGSAGDCTLGDAIKAANNDLAVNGCSAGSGQDTIIVPAGTYTLSDRRQQHQSTRRACPSSTVSSSFREPAEERQLSSATRMRSRHFA